MKSLRRVTILLATAGALAIAAALAIGFLRDSSPIIEQSAAYPSPDGRWNATLEKVDNGLGMGLGVLYYEVHVHEPGARIARHGDRDRSVAFYANSQGVGPPRIRWLDGRHLAIEYQAGRDEPGKKVDRIADVTIEYKRVNHRG